MGPVGVLALQGDFREHLSVIRRLGARGIEVRRPTELENLSALIIPGGESTTIGKLATAFGMIDPLRQAIGSGLPTLGTCAGMIFLAAATTDNQPTVLGVLDVVVERNAFGRQNESFEADLNVAGWSDPFLGIFIRGPWVAKAGSEVEILASIGEVPVFVRQGSILAAAFHPELTQDTRIHEMLLEIGEGT